MEDEAGSVVALVERQCRARPSAIAVELPDGGTRTYAELGRRASRIAEVLEPLLSAPRATVAVDLPGGMDFCAAVIAVLAGGGTLLAIDRTQPDARLATIVATARPRVVITDRRERAAWTPGSAPRPVTS